MNDKPSPTAIRCPRRALIPCQTSQRPSLPADPAVRRKGGEGTFIAPPMLLKSYDSGVGTHRALERRVGADLNASCPARPARLLTWRRWRANGVWAAPDGVRVGRA